MSTSRILDWIVTWFEILRDAVWLGVALGLDLLRHLEGLGAGLVVLVLSLAAYLFATRLQKRLNQILAADPGARVALLKLDLRFSLPALLVLPFYLLYAAARGLVRLVRSWFTKKEKEAAAVPEKRPYLVATLGPSYLLAALVTCGIYLLGRGSEPLLVAQLDLTPGGPAWQYLLLGHRPELVTQLPFERFPWSAGLLAFLLWLTIWSWSARLIRWGLQGQLGRNLIDERDDASFVPLRGNPATLHRWRSWFAVRFLREPAAPYRRWSSRLIAVAAPLLVWAWFSLGGDPYRLHGSEFAVAWLLWLSWVIHLRLRGAEKLREVAEEAPEAPAAVEASAWQAVLDDLRERLQVGAPQPCEASRPLEPLVHSTRDPLVEKVFSPLLGEVIGDLPGLTTMQHHLLREIARSGFVHTPAPAEAGELALGSPARSEDPAEVEGRRNRIVLAPEGYGKTTLAMLAASNHALVHTRATLVVVRGDAQARRFRHGLGARLDPSTVRWNVRVRRVDEDLIDDLGRGILPDVVICDLRSLVLRLLHDLDRYAAFLRNVGLVVVDDAESFAGAVEIHAQLAFRRLKRVLRELQGVAELGEDSAPMFLILAAETMHQPETWIRDLCGIDGERITYGYSEREARKREAAAKAAEGLAAGGEPPDEDQEDPASRQDEIERGPHHRFYRLVDFKTAYGEPIELGELISSCEKLAVPWHYRLCGDDRRHLGLKTLLLRDQPEYFRPAQDACVVVLEGHWSEVRREIQLLRRAGSHFSRLRSAGGQALEQSGHPEPIAFVTLVDPDEEMALTQRDVNFTLARDLAALPHPVLRPPGGRSVDAHLAADLVQHWIEVGDLIDVFGNPVAQRLRDLAGEELLLSEERVDVEELAFAYEKKLYVRALARAVAEDEDEERETLLPRKVAQVELTSEHTVRLVDRTSMNRILTVDADSANFVYYPGRVFATGKGRFVVVGLASQEGGGAEAASLARGDVLVEPTLIDDVSSPRRRIRLDHGVEGNGDRASRSGRLHFGPDPVHIGDHPIEVALVPVEVATEHFATLRLAPFSGQLRQRLLYDEESRQRFRETRLATEALTIYPNPEPIAGQDGGDRPSLDLPAARLIAAAMRGVLSSLVRGGRDQAAVALDLGDEAPEADHELGAREGIAVFDLHADGNGTARAIHRDGVELLLRLVRLVIERVLSHDRLLALHDNWADPAELARSESAGVSARDRVERDRQREFETRRRALRWLDSRLRPEGGPATYGGEGRYGKTSETGEGDFFDIGRCWYSADGSVRDLLWVKHRWRLEGGDEAALDVGFDRKTAEESRFFTENSKVLGVYAHFYREHLADEAFKLPDGAVWGAPRVVWTVAGKDEKPESSPGDPGKDENIDRYHSFASAVAAHTWPALEPLAHKLREECGAGGAVDRYRLATYLSRFVQGIPYSLPAALRRGLRPPISTLLFRRGDCDSKSLLLAILLKHCGIDAGLFVSFAERHALAAAAVPEPLGLSSAAVTVHRDEKGQFASEDDAVGEAEHDDGGGARLRRDIRGKAAAKAAWEHLEDWRRAVGLREPVEMWADLPDSPEDESMARVYVPIEATAYLPVGRSQVADPRAWSFLPLVAIWRRIMLGDRPAPSDVAEQGELPR